MQHRTTLHIGLFVLTLMLGSIAAVAAPELEVTPQKSSARPGESFPVEYTVTWQDAENPYAVLPPALPVLDWGDAEMLEMRTQNSGQTNKTRILMGFKAAEAGKYEVPAIDFRVVDWNAEDNSAVLTVTPETPTRLLTSAPVKVTVRSIGIPEIAVAATVLLLVLAGGTAFWRIKRGKQSKSEMPAISVSEQGAALLHEARRHRLDGDYYAFYRTLRQAYDLAARISNTPDDRLRSKLDAHIQDTGYRGLRPTEDDLEGDFKEVEQQVARMNKNASKEI